jgi:hypothetical protein
VSTCLDTVVRHKRLKPFLSLTWHRSPRPGAILVVDDLPTVRLLMTDVLEGLG